MATRVSSISQALAGNSAAMGIPKPFGAAEPASRGGDAGVVGGKPSGDASGLPTPPNSISPNLPPHSMKARNAKELAMSPPNVIESDIDLLDAVEHAKSHGLQRQASVFKASSYNGSDSHGMITPVFLAKHHLPEVFDGNGPVAIKDIMEHLSRTVPGFADITAAKARRIVVAALESRSGGGLDGEIEFEKVGWGKWDARLHGSARPESRDIYTIQEGNLSPPASTAGSHAGSNALRIPHSSKYLTSRRRRRQSRGSSAQDTIYSRSSDLMAVDEHEADNMSIDEDEDDLPVRYYAPRIASNPPPEENFSDTDEEDWARIGAANLRSTSYGSVGGGILPLEFNRAQSRTRTPSTPFSQSMPMQGIRKGFRPLDFTGVEADSQEREAIEALMRMGSC